MQKKKKSTWKEKFRGNTRHYSPFIKIVSKEIYAFIIFKKALYNAEGKQSHSAKVSDLETSALWESLRGFLSVSLLVWEKWFFVVP